MVSTIQDPKIVQNESIEINVLFTELLALSIQQARSKMAFYMKELPIAELFEEHAFVNRLKFFLSSNIGRVVAENDINSSAIYMFNPANNPSVAPDAFVPIDPSLHLILHVRKSTTGLIALLETLDQTLTNELRVLLPEKFENFESVIDVSIVTDKDIENQKGYAVVLQSLHAPPLKVWPL